MTSEAIIVSTNYEDILEISLNHNKNILDRILVATTKNQDATVSICKNLDIEYIYCDEYLFKNGDKFNRGAVYNYIFKNHLNSNDWIYLLDSDILLDSKFKNLYQNLDIQKFYGARRWDIQKHEDYIKIINNPSLLNQNNYTLLRGAGYGYLQLFNYNSSIFQYLLVMGGDLYPEMPTNATGDWVFRNLWGDIKYDPDFKINGHQDPNVLDRGLDLFEILPYNVIHLGITGINNQERLTEKFK